MTSPPLLTRLGWTQPVIPIHGHEVVTVELPGDGPIRLARWLHPAAQRATVGPEAGRIAALRTRLQPGDVAVVIDGGEGAEALELGLAVGPTGTVVALESNRELFPVLAANGALNRDRLRLLPHLVAVAQPDQPPPPFGIQAQPLEPFLRARHPELVDRIRWVSIGYGAQGPSLLQALQPLLSAHHPMVKVKVGPTARRAQRQALLAGLGELGYHLERLAADGTGAPEPVGAGALRGKRLELLALR